LIKTVKESGVIMREIRDLEDQVCTYVSRGIHFTVLFFERPVSCTIQAV